MSKKYGVYITSAANATFSTFSPKERVEQTLKTIESVRSRIPNAKIFLVDCGVPGVSEEVKNKLSKDIDYFLDFSKDQNVTWIQQNIQHQDTVKNLTELTVVSKFLRMARKNAWFDDCDRVFKVSGRYWLNEKFDIARYESSDVKGHYTVNKKTLSQFPITLTGQSLQYMVRLYSFDKNLLDDFIARLELMVKHMQEKVNDGKYIDIEHLFCKFLLPELVIELPKAGVSGNIAPNGQFVED
jgi:hypothetical protein